MHCIISKLTIIILTLFHFFILSLSECRSQCGKIPINYPLSIDDGCGAPQFRHMFTCNASSLALFFITLNGNYKVQSIDYKAQTLTVYDPDMSTCNVLQPHHDLHLSDVQYAIIPPSADTVFALLNCSVDSPVLHRYSFLCFEFAGHKCTELYSSCNSFRVFTTPGGGIVNPGAGNNTGPNGYFYGGGGGGGNTSAGFGTGVPGSGSNNNIGAGPPGGGFGTILSDSSDDDYMGSTPPGGGLGSGSNNMGGDEPPIGGGFGGGGNNMGAEPPPGVGGFGTGGNNNMGGAGPPSSYGTGVVSGGGGGGSSNNNNNNMGAGAPGVGTGTTTGVPSPPCCFTGYSTLKVMSMDILDCSHYTSFYDVDKLRGVGPIDWSYGLKFSFSVPDMGCERCTKSGGSCGFDVQTEALLCLCPDSRNSTRQCGNDMDYGRREMPSIILQMLIICFPLLFLLY